MPELSPCIDHGRKARGYAKVGSPPLQEYLHRRVLAEKLGRPLQPAEVCRHTCDNPRCVNPAHLLVGTQRDNVQDAVERSRMRHGAEHYAAKLDVETVRRIREEYIPRSRTHGTRAIARRLGVSQWVVSHAIRGKTWAHVQS